MWYGLFYKLIPLVIRIVNYSIQRGAGTDCKAQGCGLGAASSCNNRHVDVGYKVTSMLFIAKAVLK